ncbi:MAG: hypothetical protein FWD73_14210 [Polyangiaceae bacterium]|nr:hypothetical protein [Polyangiaceae bacterium]
MKHTLRTCTTTLLVALVFAATMVPSQSGCHSEGAACQVDGDCAPGSICQNNQCVSVLPSDAGTDSGAPSTVCAAPGTTCTVDADCCSLRCSTVGRCEDTASGSSGCSDLYGVCTVNDDCCAGYSCLSGACH